MGGATTEISDSTTEVLLEMAWWDPPSISRTVKRLNLPSEASSVRAAPTGATISIGRCAGSSSWPPSRVSPPSAASSTFPARPRSHAGSGSGREGQRSARHGAHRRRHGRSPDLNRVRGDDGRRHAHVVVPTWRWDTATETDIAEEVGRMFGYENIPRTVPKGDDPGRLQSVPERPPTRSRGAARCGM